MKKSVFIGLVAILGLVGCSRNQEIDIPDANLSLFARTESPADTKTVVESGVHVYWEPGDEIAVFMGEQSAKFTTDITAASGTATFKGTFGDQGWPEDLDLWAVYPFSEEAEFDGESITTTLPSEQIAREGSFGKDMNLSIAHSNSSTLQFYNVGGGIRFSVTEEGIKKVMFEGLSGEIISGKVKIGFEDGLPVVTEVTGGSQFITLLPPTGKKAFEKDTWYYIVAIPGSLEGGYKLRFYKDTDYARKVSEKAVVIKRSIFGNIEKADKGIEYEVQTTHFPETEEEIEDATSMVSEITNTIKPILEKCSSHYSFEEISLAIAKEIEHVDGVISSAITESGNVYFLTRDSIYVNIPIEQFQKQSSSWGNNFHSFSVPHNQENGIGGHRTNATLPSGKKALALFPRYDEAMDAFQWSEYGVNLYAGFITSLESCGYEVDSYYNDDAILDLFRGKNWKKYDVVYFNTHGDKDLMTARNGVPTTAFMTSSLVEDTSGLAGLINDMDHLFGFLSLCIWENRVHYWITTQAIEHDDPSFNNTWLFAHACHSSARGDIAEYCLANGAAGYSGFTNTANKLGSAELVSNMLFAFTSGMNFEKAEAWAKKNSFYQGTQTIVNDVDIFKCDQRDDVEALYLVNPTPYNLISVVDGSSVSFSWEKQPTNGYYEFSLCIDGERLGKQFFSNHDYSSCSANYTVSSAGEHTWYVIANLIIGGKTEASYRSQEERFMVTESSQPNNTIYYTSTNGEIVTPSAPDAFEANIISNVFTDGKGVITFNQDITQVGDSAFVYCTNLSSISLPGSVQIIGAGAFVYCTSLRSVNLSKDITIYDRAFSNTALSGTVHVNAFYGNAFEDTNVENIYTYSTVKDDYSDFEQCLRGIPVNSTIHVIDIIYQEMTGIVDAQLTQLETDIQKVIDDSYASIYLMENYLAMIEKDIINLMESGYREDVFDHAREYIMTLYERISLYELWLKENYEMLIKKTPYLTPFFMDSYNYYMSKIEDHFYYANNKLFELDHHTQRLENELYELRPNQSPTNANRQSLSAQTKKVYSDSSSSSIPAVTADLFHSHTVSFTPSE